MEIILKLNALTASSLLKYASNISKHRRIVHENQQLFLDENPGLTHNLIKSTSATNEYMELDKWLKTPEPEHILTKVILHIIYVQVRKSNYIIITLMVFWEFASIIGILFSTDFLK